MRKNWSEENNFSDAVIVRIKEIEGKACKKGNLKIEERRLGGKRLKFGLFKAYKAYL